MCAPKMLRCGTSVRGSQIWVCVCVCVCVCARARARARIHIQKHTYTRTLIHTTAHTNTKRPRGGTSVHGSILLFWATSTRPQELDARPSSPPVPARLTAQTHGQIDAAHLHSVVPAGAEQHVFVLAAVSQREDAVRVPYSLVTDSARQGRLQRFCRLVVDAHLWERGSARGERASAARAQCALMTV